MVIDCAECAMRDTAACDDCVVSFLIGASAGVVRISDDEAAAMRRLADAGMVAPLRLVRRVDRSHPEGPTRFAGPTLAG